MNKSINILDQDYSLWLQDLSKRYRRSQVKASIKVNCEMLKFYWSLGRDIVAMKAETRWGSKFFKNLSKDLKEQIPNASCFSVTNLKYMKNFYLLYMPYLEQTHQLGGKGNCRNDFGQQVVDQLEYEGNQFGQQVADQIWIDITSIPWGHHTILIDKYLDNPEKALFYVRQTVQNGWSRNMLLNFIGTGLYERQGKALTNFKQTLPNENSDLAQELTKDPYNFGFTEITKSYNERILKDALLNNITTFLTELGTGFAYVGKEYRLTIGEKENFIDLLFYNLNLSCYIVIEVKIGAFTFADVGQLGGYVVACNHILRKEGRDNPTIGLLICKEKDRIQAQYALESSSQPIAISEYDLEKFYPEKLEGTMPTIEEIEERLSKK